VILSFRLLTASEKLYLSKEEYEPSPLAGEGQGEGAMGNGFIIFLTSNL
jgi:hypothetical protein